LTGYFLTHPKTRCGPLFWLWFFVVFVFVLLFLFYRNG
jgi:hypothetical protein